MRLTKDNYFSDEAARKFFSVSQVKLFQECEARALAELKGDAVRDSNTALLVGGYVDAHFSDEMEEYTAAHPELYTIKGELRSEYRQADMLIERVERDPLAMSLLKGQKQQVLKGAIDGYLFKAKMDIWLNKAHCQSIAKQFPQMDSLIWADGAIVDFKVMRDFEPMYKPGEGRMNFIEYWQYDLQMAVYQRLKRQATGHQNIPCFILAITKERVPNIGLFEIPQPLMDASLEIMLEGLPRISNVKSGTTDPDRCGQCDYCKDTKALTCAEWLEEWA